MIPVSINDNLIKTSPIRIQQIEIKKPSQNLSLQDLMDSAVLGEPLPPRNEDRFDSGMHTTKESILERVIAK